MVVYWGKSSKHDPTLVKFVNDYPSLKLRSSFRKMDGLAYDSFSIFSEALAVSFREGNQGGGFKDFLKFSPPIFLEMMKNLTPGPSTFKSWFLSGQNSAMCWSFRVRSHWSFDPNLLGHPRIIFTSFCLGGGKYLEDHPSKWLIAMVIGVTKKT